MDTVGSELRKRLLLQALPLPLLCGLLVTLSLFSTTALKKRRLKKRRHCS